MRTDFDFFIPVENVELGKSDFVRALTAYAVARSDDVERTYPSIKLLEKLCGCKIKYVSVGAERDACIEMY
mgnify:CR=1 FL=1